MASLLGWRVNATLDTKLQFYYHFVSLIGNIETICSRIFSLRGEGVTNPTGATTRVFSKSTMKGRFAYRFRGFALYTAPNSPPVTLYLNGVGILEMDGTGNVSGHQSSAATPIAATWPVPGYPLECNYDVTGTYSVNSDGTGDAAVTLTPQPGENCAVENVFFRTVAIDEDRIWITSIKPTVAGNTVDEVCEGEAVRI